MRLHSTQRRWFIDGRTAPLCALLALTVYVLPLAAQDSPREARTKAQMALSQGAYGDAIDALEKLVSWFAGSTKETTVVEMEVVYYQLGLCHFFLGQFAEARTTFETYLKKYRTGQHAYEVAVYIGDTYRFEAKFNQALKSYINALKKYPMDPDLKADVLASMARCYLAQDKWDKAMPVLRRLYSVAPDFSRRNWAATLLTTAYLKERDLEKVYKLVPYLLAPDSFASRSVALNMAALESGDQLFQDEHYREALWVYRLVYPHDLLTVRSQQYMEQLERRAEYLKRIPENPRPLMRVQEAMGELEAEIKALEAIENYDSELYFRMARAYMEIHRYREATELFVLLHGEAQEPKAGEALFLAFSCAFHIQPWDRAFELGLEYLNSYNAGEYYDQVSLMIGQMYAKLEDWPQVIAILTKALEISPKHERAAECMFLVGYASFMEEKYEDTIKWLDKMNRTYPGNEREADGVYWLGMAYMFQKQFTEAAAEFDAILHSYPNTPYEADAAFRRAVCDYGNSLFKESENRLKAFVAQYPTNKLCGEAYMMLGDTAGARGELAPAVSCFDQVSRYDVNIEFYNYATFRSGEMLNEMRDFPRMITHFKEYIRRNREGSNIPLAMYWIGTAMWGMGEQRGALEYFRQGIEKYGVDRKALGIDLILENWIGQVKSADKAVNQLAWKDLNDLLQKAEKEHQAALALRLKRACLFEPNITEERHQALLKDLVREENITNASPGVLELMMEEAKKQTNQALAVKVAQCIIKDFVETDYALQARMMLARNALAERDYPTAVRHLTVVKEVYATSPDAAEALLLLGDLYVKQGKFPQADECYKSVLAVREWKGPLWPAALYGRGECARLQRNYDTAAAYFERIYVMYGNYKQWVAKAYVARAECLTRLQLYSKAAETLQELLSIAELKDMPEFKEAQQRMESLKGK
jgi:tetratricopeptide (TPR) repeat protein